MHGNALPQQHVCVICQRNALQLGHGGWICMSCQPSVDLVDGQDIDQHSAAERTVIGPTDI